MKYDIIEAGAKTVRFMQQTTVKSVMSFFNTEENVLLYLNPYLLKFVMTLYMKHASDQLLSQVNNLPNLFNIKLAFALYLQEDKSGVVNSMY